jgi:hypothetical protein
MDIAGSFDVDGVNSGDPKAKSALCIEIALETDNRRAARARVFARLIRVAAGKIQSS